MQQLFGLPLDDSLFNSVVSKGVISRKPTQIKIISITSRGREGKTEEKKEKETESPNTKQQIELIRLK